MDKLFALKQVPVFEDVPDDVLRPMLDYFIRKEYERGDHLWREGAAAHNFTFIVEGQVKVVKVRNDGRETILGVFDEGDAVGQIAVYQRVDYPATAVALADTVVLEIFRDHFFGLLKQHTPLLEAVIHSMMTRNRDLVRRIHELTLGSAEQRLALLFLRFGEKLGVRRRLDDGTMGIHVPLALSRNDIAELINVRVETAIRMMSRWNKEGPVRTEADGFLITDGDLLEAMAFEIK